MYIVSCFPKLDKLRNCSTLMNRVMSLNIQQRIVIWHHCEHSVKLNENVPVHKDIFFKIRKYLTRTCVSSVMQDNILCVETKQSATYGVPLGPHSRSRATPFYLLKKTRDFHMIFLNI